MMKTVLRTLRFPSLLAAFALAASLPLATSAQSALDTGQAQAFLGTWSLSMDSPQGPFVMSMEIKDMSGKVAATISNDMTGTAEVTDISRSGDDLVLRYEIDAQGQVAPVALTLTPDGEALTATMDFADGAFVMDGCATK
jgi:hypothetical protein